MEKNYEKLELISRAAGQVILMRCSSGLYMEKGILGEANRKRLSPYTKAAEADDNDAILLWDVAKENRNGRLG